MVADDDMVQQFDADDAAGFDEALQVAELVVHVAAHERAEEGEREHPGDAWPLGVADEDGLRALPHGPVTATERDA